VRFDNIKIYLREIGWDGVDWMDMAQDRDQWRALVNTVLNLRDGLAPGPRSLKSGQGPIKGCRALILIMMVMIMIIK
jgi:hypothetical protein